MSCHIESGRTRPGLPEYLSSAWSDPGNWASPVWKLRWIQRLRCHPLARRRQVSTRESRIAIKSPDLAPPPQALSSMCGLRCCLPPNVEQPLCLFTTDFPHRQQLALPARKPTGISLILFDSISYEHIPGMSRKLARRLQKPIQRRSAPGSIALNQTLNL